jgi:hypothetical protein
MQILEASKDYGVGTTYTRSCRIWFKSVSQWVTRIAGGLSLEQIKAPRVEERRRIRRLVAPRAWVACTCRVAAVAVDARFAVNQRARQCASRRATVTAYKLIPCSVSVRFFMPREKRVVSATCWPFAARVFWAQQSSMLTYW